MNTARTTLLAAGLLTATSLPLVAQQGYPRLVGDAYSPTVEYAPGFRGDILGGGAVAISNAEEGRIEVSHSDARFTQGRTDGRVPVMLGGEDDHSVTWITPDGARNIARTTTMVPVMATASGEGDQAMAQLAPVPTHRQARRSSSPRRTSRTG